jgi:hypothetical protein
MRYDLSRFRKLINEVHSTARCNADVFNQERIILIANPSERYRFGLEIAELRHHEHAALIFLSSCRFLHEKQE